MIQKLGKLKRRLVIRIITTPEFNNLAAGVFTARLAQNLVIKIDFGAKLQSLKKKITSNKTKNLLVQTEFKN